MTLTYRDAGVDADEGDRLVERIKPLAARTNRPEVLAGIGGFGGLVRVPLERYREPVLVSGTDGVGTKLKIAFATGIHDTVGIDLVAMCVNDVIVSGAEPLYFLDYFATGKLESGTAEKVIAGIAEGCARAGCALIGGETAELPGFYAKGEYDLAGFAVGVVERARIVDGSRIEPGHRVVGVASNGIHSNGYSLARKVLLEKAKLKFDADMPGCARSVGEELLRPTHIYAKLTGFLAQAALDIRGMAHITGGGLPGNLSRPLPKKTAAVLDARRWPIPPVFRTIQKLGPVEPSELAKTFNLGLGFCIITPASDVRRTIDTAGAVGLDAWEVGQIVASDAEEPTVTLENLS
jgi:phosphoribosylformylglycinamidine cyclo-ligase